MKPKSVISWLVILTLAIGAQRRVTAAGDSLKKGPSKGGYTLTQLDDETSVANSVVQYISDNGVVAGDAISPEFMSFAWSADTGLVLLTLGGSTSVATAVSPNGIVTGASATVGDAAVRGFVWTVSGGIAEIGNFRGGFTTPQDVNSSGVVVGDAITSDGRTHAFVWTASGGMVDLDPSGVDSGARFVTEDGLIVGSIYTETSQSVIAGYAATGMKGIGSLGTFMSPDHVNQHGAIAGTFYRDDETSGTFFWSQATGLIDIGSLGGDEIRPTGLSETGTIVGYGETAAGETHAFVWSGPGTLVDLGTLGGDFSFANAVNGNGLIVGYSTAANGWEHAFAWTAADGMIALGTLGGPRSSAKFVNDAGMIVGTSNAPGHQGLHAFVWTAAAGMVEMPSLGRLDAVWAMSANGSFAGFSSGKKSVEDQHAVLWTPATASASLTQADAKSPITSTVALEVPVGDER